MEFAGALLEAKARFPAGVSASGPLTQAPVRALGRDPAYLPALVALDVLLWLGPFRLL